LSAPWKPLLGVIKIGETEIGAGLASASSLSFSLDVDRYYGIGGDGKPKLVKGNKAYTGRFSKAYIDKTYAELVKGGTAADIILYPEGKTTGKQTITVKNAILKLWDFRMDENAVVAESLDFEGDDLVFGTAT